MNIADLIAEVPSVACSIITLAAFAGHDVSNRQGRR